jgi:SAM-dependent methyltransferase
VIVILYTTEYRTGGRQLQQAAETLARTERAAGYAVLCRATESKRAVVDALAECRAIDALHIVSHSGLYGPMFGTTDMPEQFSPHEWRELSIPFASGAEAFIHACRSGRWFAAFFARTFDVPTWGYHLYTTVSRHPGRYRRVPEDMLEDADVWVVGQPGRKSHGLLGSAGKYLGLLPPRPMVCHRPGEVLDGASYDRVAALYDATFEDIRVRGPEVGWLAERVSEDARVLDLGCGTGGLLRLLRDRPHRVGADVSGAMLAHARGRDSGATYLQLNGPRLPLEDDSLDVVISLLSWRYLDWDPILAEVARVLRPGGRLLVVDMVSTPARPAEWPTVAKHKLREVAHSRRFPEYRAARVRLTSDAGWAQMLRYNPMRAEHEYRWFFGSRFPDSRTDVLDIGMHSRVLGIDSGPIDNSWFPPQSYP